MMLITNEHKCVSNFNYAIKMKNRILPPSQSISSRDAIMLSVMSMLRNRVNVHIHL